MRRASIIAGGVTVGAVSVILAHYGWPFWAYFPAGFIAGWIIGSQI